MKLRDLDANNSTGVYCRAPSGSGWVCTRAKDHVGMHVAHTGGSQVLGWWYPGGKFHDTEREWDGDFFELIEYGERPR